MPAPGPVQTPGAMPEAAPAAGGKKGFPMPILIGAAVVLVLVIVALIFL